MRNASAILRIVGLYCAVMAIPLVLVGCFVGPIVLLGGAAHGIAAVVAFGLAYKLIAGSE